MQGLSKERYSGVFHSFLQCFGETSCFRLQGDRNKWLWMLK